MKNLLMGNLLKKTGLLVGMMMLMLAPVVAQTNLYVDGSVSSSGAGTTWGTAYKYLSEALSVANAGSGDYNISIAQGIYYPTTGGVNVTDKSLGFLISRKGISLYGGYQAGGVSRNTKTFVTTLSGDIGTLNTDTDNLYHVLIVSPLTNTGGSTTFDGITITGGYSSSTETGSTEYNSISIQNYVGGGIAFRSSVGITGYSINDCLIKNNAANNTSAGLGGGIHINGFSMDISNSFFVSNAAGSKGGGILTSQVSDVVNFINDVFASNTSINNGGAVGLNGNTDIINCTFISNSTTASGGAIRVTSNGNADIKIYNNVFYNNTANGDATTENRSDFSNGDVTNIVIIKNNYLQTTPRGPSSTPTAYPNVTLLNNLPASPNNTDPGLFSAASPLGADGYFGTVDDGARITTSSPCKNAGLNSLLNTTTYPNDITGVSRIANTTIDMGAYEISPNISVTTSTFPSLNICINGTSPYNTFSVSGVDLTANVTVTAPTGFQVSTATGSGYASSLTLTRTGSTVSATNVYVKLTSTTVAGSFSGNISLASTGATAKTLAVVGVVSATSVGGSISGGASVCSGTNSTVLTLSGHTGSITKWQSATNSGFTTGLTDIANTATTYTASNLTTTTYYRAVITSGTCTSANSATATVTVNAIPTPTFTVQPGATACASTDVTYTTQSGQTNYVWTVPGTLNTDYSITSGGVGTSSNTVTLKWLTTGSKTVTINYTNSNGCTAASATSSTATTVSAPTLGTYSATTVTAGQNTSITPTAAPTNSTSIVAYSTTNFSGTLTVNLATGVVSIINAKQAGTYLVTVKAFSSAGCTSATTFTLTVSNPLCSQGNFSGSTNLSVGASPTSVAIGDFNGDGKQDLAAANNGGTTVSIRLGDGNGGFTGSTEVSVGASPNSVAIGDFNGDGKQDFATGQYGSSLLYIRLGDGNGGFSVSANVSVGLHPFSVAIGDFNGDGKQDIAAANFGGTTVSIRLGDGTGGFSGTTDVSVGASPTSVAIGDFNGDGNQDIAAANYGGTTVSISLGNGSGGFSVSTAVSVGSSPYSVAIGDFNGDGNLDIAAANSGGTTVSIRLGDGTGGFSGTTDVSVGSAPVSVSIGDFNGDGKQDIAAANSGSASVSIRLGVGTGGFSGTTNVSVQTNPRSVPIGDFNGDGRQDIAVANYGSASVSIRLGVGNDINIKGNTVSIVDGDNTPSTNDNSDFGSTCFPSTIIKTFTIENTGTSSLALSSGSITLTGADNAMFTIGGITLPATIAAGSSTTFTVTFSPSSTGTKMATIHIASDDCDESDYDFAVQAIANALPTPSFTAQPGATAFASTDVTYTTESGQSNYVWTLPGTLNTDYTITSGSISTSSNTVTLKWLTTGSKTVTINYTSNGCTAATATSSTATTLSASPSGFTWTGGGGSNLWDDPLNWSTGTAPLATSVIVISSGTPRLNIDYAIGGTLTISGTGTLTINPGKTLSISTGGVVDFGGKSVTIKSDLTGTAQIGRIQGTLSGATNVTVERYIPATGRRYRMIAPSVNTTESIKANWMEGNINTSGTNVNTVAGYGTQITGPGGNANGFDVTGTNAASLYLTTNGVTPSYASIANTNGTLSASTGYFLFLRGDRSMNMSLFNTNIPPNPVPLPTSVTTLRATGTVVQGTVSLTSSLSTAAGGFSMITNPYPAAIDWTAVQAASTNINNYYTYWDPNLGFRGGFTTVTATTSTPSSSASNTIQSGQAFFVTTTADGSASVSIQESHKVGVNTNNVHGIFKANTTVDDIVSTKVKGISPVWENYQPNLQATTSTIPEFRISLYYTEASGTKRLTDGAVALFDNQYTSALDGNDAVDAPNWDENIAITRNGQNLAIESRAELNENDTLAISMSSMKSMNYELQFQGSNFGSTLLQPMLIDNYLKTLNPLSLNSPTTVPFTVTSDTATSSKNRFKVIFIPSSVLPFTVTKVTAAKKNETVQVDWEVKTDEDLKSFDVERSSEGRNFVKLATVASLGKGITLASYSWVDNNPLMGANYYRIKVIPLSGKEKVSPVAKATMDKNKPSMEVYPNPTKGNDFSIKLSHLTKGSYQVIVTTATGQQVLVKSIEHPGGTVDQRMVFANDISKGVYRVQVKGEGISLLSSIIKN